MSGAAYGIRRTSCPTSLGRFMARVDKTDGCWEWTAGKSKGYGIFYPHRRANKAHRWLYELAKGPIPPGLTLDHLCRNAAMVFGDFLAILDAEAQR